jgi:hypothetical protein
MDADRVVRLVHLIRNPLHNIVARYHLDRRHLVEKNASVVTLLPNNGTGFQRWCRNLDETYAAEEELLESTTRQLMLKVPCRGEFYKYTRWHEHALNMVPLLHDSIPVMTLYYEDYHYRFNESVQRLMDFVQQVVVSPLRPFRSLPTYQDHYSDEQTQAIRALMQHVASPRLWNLLKRYFDQP